MAACKSEAWRTAPATLGGRYAILRPSRRRMDQGDTPSKVPSVKTNCASNPMSSPDCEVNSACCVRLPAESPLGYPTGCTERRGWRVARMNLSGLSDKLVGRSGLRVAGARRHASPHTPPHQSVPLPNFCASQAQTRSLFWRRANLGKAPGPAPPGRQLRHRTSRMRTLENQCPGQKETHALLSKRWARRRGANISPTTADPTHRHSGCLAPLARTDTCVAALMQSNRPS